MSIDELVAAFAALPGATVSAGPRHPTSPDPAVAPNLTVLFAEFPGLERDPSYVEFMWRYAGLSRENDDDTELFAVYGFGPLTARFYADLDVPMVDEQGFFPFAECVVHADTTERIDTYTHLFTLSLADDRPAGVYRASSTMRGSDPGYGYHAADFRSFLAEAVAKGGVWERPALP